MHTGSTTYTRDVTNNHKKEDMMAEEAAGAARGQSTYLLTEFLPVSVVKTLTKATKEGKP